MAVNAPSSTAELIAQLEVARVELKDHLGDLPDDFLPNAVAAIKAQDQMLAEEFVTLLKDDLSGAKPEVVNQVTQLRVQWEAWAESNLANIRLLVKLSEQTPRAAS